MDRARGRRSSAQTDFGGHRESGRGALKLRLRNRLWIFLSSVSKQLGNPFLDLQTLKMPSTPREIAWASSGHPNPIFAGKIFACPSTTGPRRRAASSLLASVPRTAHTVRRDRRLARHPFTRRPRTLARTLEATPHATAPRPARDHPATLEIHRGVRGAHSPLFLRAPTREARSPGRHEGHLLVAVEVER